MNAVEHIVEEYFRICRGCFTMRDVKVPGGNNRQFDLLAYNLKDGSQYHIECSVTLMLAWCKGTVAEVEELFDKKFLGVPPIREGAKTVHEKRKTYRPQIWAAYEQFGFEPEKVQRIWVPWTDRYIKNLAPFLEEYRNSNRIKIEVWCLRDKIIHELQEAIATSNYDDEVLRTLSLLKQKEIQDKEEEKAKQLIPS